jgi:hypothetical protein
MKYFFSIKNILVVYITAILTTNTHNHSEQTFFSINQEELAELSLKGLENILWALDCHSFPNLLPSNQITIPKVFLPDREKIISFLGKPLIISSLGLDIIDSTEERIVEMFKTLGIIENDVERRKPNQNHLKSNEYFLLKKMCKVIRLIKFFLSNIEKIKNMELSTSRDELIKEARTSHLRLYYAILHIRFTSFLDYVDSSGALFDSSTKLELASNIYSIAIKVLKKTKDILN